jgi:hypothetical protein
VGVASHTTPATGTPSEVVHKVVITQKNGNQEENHHMRERLAT